MPTNFVFLNRQPRGSVLVVAIGIMIALTGMALVFSRQMRVEALASGNFLASAQSDAIVRGAAVHVMSQLSNNQDRTSLDTDVQSEAVAIGDGQFWLVRPDPDDERKYAYGLIDEGSKLNINTATVDMLLRLPGMTSELAASIVDWRDEDENVTEGGGAESEYYLLLPDPYYCKNAPFETLDELQLVKGATPEILYGVDLNHNGVVDDRESSGKVQLAGLNGQAQCGVCKYLTVYSAAPNVSTTGSQRLFVGDNRTQTLTALTNLLSKASFSADRILAITTLLRNAPPATNIFDFYQKSGMKIDEFRKIADQITTDRTPILVGRVNVNTAPRDVLRCLPGLEDADADAIIAKRQSNGPDLENIAWVAEALPVAKASQIAAYITTRSYQYSADIVGVNGNGRGMKRVKYVYDMRSTPPHVLYCKDMTQFGWPLADDLRESLRGGYQLPQNNGAFSLGGR